MKTTTIGLDLAKNVFHVVCFDKHFKEQSKRMLRRRDVLKYFANIPPCLIGMEACSGSSYWGRELKQLGHNVKLMPAQHVKRYLQGNKNDYNDARAIAEATTRPKIPTVPVKTPQEQDMQALHRMRSQCMRDRTALSNSTRGLLSEYGIILPKGISQLRQGIPELLEDADNALSDFFRELLARRYQQLIELDEHITFYTQHLEKLARQDEACRRLQTIPGFGPIASSAFRSAIGNGENFSKGRDVAASLGLVPRQHSSGGKNVLLGISKRGDRYLRTLLVHGARAVVNQAERKSDPLSLWINRIRRERGWNKAVVAMANKMARMGWAILRHHCCYQPLLSQNA
ncbi:MAG TPA: IS110 family transposase [Desulfobulbaceae bacterium]|nr:IS110 family transposase [Desulfobulbaceae bacterium]